MSGRRFRMVPNRLSDSPANSEPLCTPPGKTIVIFLTVFGPVRNRGRPTRPTATGDRSNDPEITSKDRHYRRLLQRSGYVRADVKQRR
ncbi:Hypothetical protein CINCED_3A020859 [Cinara cedri]|uniref:Uncharacterized protein n=1 Tax=Cinara cedri TaxID=506608 RepID=A0A5E4MQU4_9HEMI|nr:Hypothetical protein CINCED_3A020859 [Cinara cedri]